MTHFSIVHDFDGTIESFWQVFFDEPYNVELYKRLKVKERKMLLRDEDDQHIKFSVRIMPERDLPGFIKRILGGDLGYVETSTFHKGKDYLDVNVEPTLMKERTKIKALYTLKPIGAGKLRRTFEGDIGVDVPLVGRKIEELIIADMKKSYDVAAEVTGEWLRRTT